MIYFTADLHLGHEAILYMAERPYKNLDEMNQTLIRNINAFVTDRDTLYILGDIAHKLEVPDAEEWIRQIHGKKILIRGNHDKEYDPSLFEEICDYKEITVDETRFILMHYPLRAWHKMKNGAIQLHGHIHSKSSYNRDNRENGIYQYDVGVDANDYCPVSAQQIIDYFKDVPLQKRDYHIKDTDD